MNKIRVFCVDDNFVARRGLRSVLEAEGDIEVVGEASSGSEALKRLRECPADVVLMDIRMSDLDGIETTSLLLREIPGIRVLMATVAEDLPTHMKAILAGASGYLVYGQFVPESLIDAVRTVASGKCVNIPQLPETSAGNALIEGNGLTQREREILKLIAAGKDNREIASALDIEEKTVKNHINSIYSKINVNSRQEAMYLMLNSMIKNKPRG
jgi:DNA-binding NarL/FixJ family response regulator